MTTLDVRRGTDRTRWLTAGGEMLLAVFSDAAAPRGPGIALVHSGVHTMTAHNGRVWVRYARALSALGHPTVRFDFAGSGDSSGTFERRRDGQPVADVCAAIDALVDGGAREVVVVGHCFGAVAALQAALERPVVRSLVLLAPPLTPVAEGQTTVQAGGRTTVAGELRSLTSATVIRRIAADADYRRWLAGRLKRRIGSELRRRPAPDRRVVGVAELDRLTRSGVRVRILYGDRDRLHADFVEACAGPLGRIVRRPEVEVEVLAGSVHSLAEQDVQTEVLAAVAAAAGTAGHR